jgi:hypothetical protein
LRGFLSRAGESPYHDKSHPGIVELAANVITNGNRLLKSVIVINEDSV